MAAIAAAAIKYGASSGFSVLNSPQATGTVGASISIDRLMSLAVINPTNAVAAMTKDHKTTTPQRRFITRAATPSAMITHPSLNPFQQPNATLSAASPRLAALMKVMA